MDKILFQIPGFPNFNPIIIGWIVLFILLLPPVARLFKSAWRTYTQAETEAERLSAIGLLASYIDSGLFILAGTSIGFIAASNEPVRTALSLKGIITLVLFFLIPVSKLMQTFVIERTHYAVIRAVRKEIEREHLQSADNISGSDNKDFQRSLGSIDQEAEGLRT